MEISNKTVAKNVIWRYSERILAQFITFFVSLVLARLLSPDDYGVIALVMTIITIFDGLSANGFSQALIQKKEISNIDYATIFITNLLMALIFYFLIFFTAPFIADFYKNGKLVILLRILGLSILINAFNSVQRAYVQRNMLFKKFFFSTLFGTLLSAVLGILFALKGYGVWALVIQTLTNTVVDTLILFITIELKASMRFSIKSLKEMMSFGIKMQISCFFESVVNEVRTFIISKIYSSSDLAYYNKGKGLPMLIISSIQMSVGDVFFSALSREPDDKRILCKVREYLSLMFYILCPLMVGLAVLSNQIIIVLYSEKWVSSVPFVWVYSIIYLTWIVQMVLLQSLKASGRMTDILILSIIPKVLDIILLLITMKKGVLYIAFSSLFTNIIITCYLLIRMKLLFFYNIKDMMVDLLPSFLFTIIAMIPILFIKNIIHSNYICIILSLLCSVITYIVLSHLFKLKPYKQIISLLKHVVGEKSVKDN